MKKRNFAAIAAVLFVLCASACGGNANTNPVQIEATEEEKNVLPGELSAIEAALGAYTVIEHRCAAVRAGNHRRNGSLVVGSALIASRRRDFVFRMCHF